MSGFSTVQRLTEIQKKKNNLIYSVLLLVILHVIFFKIGGRLGNSVCGLIVILNVILVVRFSIFMKRPWYELIVYGMLALFPFIVLLPMVILAKISGRTERLLGEAAGCSDVSTDLATEKGEKTGSDY
jgi:hypothetical protein